MKCPNCGSENPDDKKFCGECGATLPQPVKPSQAQVAPSWVRSNWKLLTSVIVVLIVVLAIVGLIYSQPWSKIKVLVNSQYTHAVGVNVYIDGVLKVAMDINVGQTILGPWPVDPGSHVVSLDHGTWDIYRSGDGTIYYYTGSYEGPDGTMDFAYTYGVGPLFTKNVFIDVNLPA